MRQKDVADRSISGNALPNQPVSRSRRRRCAPPLARLPRRALPLGGPPGARRATVCRANIDQHGTPGPKLSRAARRDVIVARGHGAAGACAGASPGRASYAAPIRRQPPATRMILCPAPPHPAQPTGRGASTTQSIMQPSASATTVICHSGPQCSNGR